MQWTLSNVTRTFLHPGRHALGVTAVLTVAMIAARIAAESTTRRVLATHLAEEPAGPVLAPRPRPYVHHPRPPADPPTIPLSRAEMLGPDPAHERAIGGAL